MLVFVIWIFLLRIEKWKDFFASSFSFCFIEYLKKKGLFSCTCLIDE